MRDRQTRCGFVATLGRPNAGKSTLLNALLGQKISLTSHKANATRKQLQVIVPHSGVDRRGAYDAQIVFVDTPGIHHQEKLLNQYMLNQSLRAMSDCDMGIYLAPASDELRHYEEFLNLSRDRAVHKRHILLISKIDMLDSAALMRKLAAYQAYQSHYLALIPMSVKRGFSPEVLLGVVAEFLPDSAFLFDEECITTAQTREIVKEFIRESLFENLSDEIPYESDVIIQRYEEGEIERIYATIIVEKQSQKGVVIGASAQTIKRIGTFARKKIESLVGKKVFLKLEVRVQKGWSKEAKKLKQVGYDCADMP